MILNVSQDVFDSWGTVDNLDQRRIFLWPQIVLCILGFFGSCICVIVFTRPALVNSINILLVALEATNALCILSIIPTFLELFFPQINMTYGKAVSDNVCSGIGTVLLFVSSVLTVVIGLWRLFVIGYPLNVPVWCTRSRTKKVIAIIYLSSALLAIPFIAMFNYETVTFQMQEDGGQFKTKTVYFIWLSDFSLKNNQLYYKIIVIIMFLMEIVPCISLALVTGLIFYKLKMARNARIKLQIKYSNVFRENQVLKENVITICLLIMLLFFLISYVTDSVVTVMMLVGPITNVINGNLYLISQSKVLFLTCNCISFILYYIMSDRFRKTLRKMFACPKFIRKTMSVTTVSSVDRFQPVPL